MKTWYVLYVLYILLTSMLRYGISIVSYVGEIGSATMKLNCTFHNLLADFETRPGGSLNINMSSYQYRDPSVKDKTVSRPSYLLHGNPHTWKDGLYTETGPRFGHDNVGQLLASQYISAVSIGRYSTSLIRGLDETYHQLHPPCKAN